MEGFLVWAQWQIVYNETQPNKILYNSLLGWLQFFFGHNNSLTYGGVIIYTAGGVTMKIGLCWRLLNEVMCTSVVREDNLNLGPFRFLSITDFSINHQKLQEELI